MEIWDLSQFSKLAYIMYRYDGQEEVKAIKKIAKGRKKKKKRQRVSSPSNTEKKKIQNDETAPTLIHPPTTPNPTTQYPHHFSP